MDVGRDLGVDVVGVLVAAFEPARPRPGVRREQRHAFRVALLDLRLQRVVLAPAVLLDPRDVGERDHVAGAAEPPSVWYRRRRLMLPGPGGAGLPSIDRQLLTRRL